MKTKDTCDTLTSLLAVISDAAAIFAGFIVATWIRFGSGLIPLYHDSVPKNLYELYSTSAAVATIMSLLLFRSLRLFVRPQTGMFSDKIPRILRAIIQGMLISIILAYAVRTNPPLSRLTIVIAMPCIASLVLLERFLLFKLEIYLAKTKVSLRKVLILGTGFVAARIGHALLKEPRLRSEIKGYLHTDTSNIEPVSVPCELILGDLDQLSHFIDEGETEQIILADTNMGREKTLDILILCEKACIDFKIVPDLLYVLTGTLDVLTVEDIPLLGITRWPLDSFWNRVLKRTADIIGALFGLVILSPLFVILALVIKKTSKGDVFFRQERCGEDGRRFIMYKFRTMKHDAEKTSGPVWATENDPRTTKIGAFLRRNNLDELPQLWNVLRGDMSLVGPRPERPYFVEQFKEDIDRYMWRHVSKPGMTGWAQVNGLRGDTDIKERIKYDLYYLENWSLMFDFKILAKTFFARKNAY
ncbi:MAG: undecaprenyl-phosphate glucose phosphotransferase [Lentisphaerae bacterium]|jgi:exopolysaccharide biosynthesis polyprenyl glycosylphosphotransferase|nr:undecaprenyl-phosphate glucose phosphotransferase [Lentisphaerota bacterium]